MKEISELRESTEGGTAMERRISIKDIAKEAKVSIGSASQALNGRRNTSDELRRAVELAAKRLG
jgi:transcriptional regulator with XRE-family HTH domain